MEEQKPTSPAHGHRTVTEAAVAAFGTITGDYARMHFDRQLGIEMGGAVAHGLLGACWAVGTLTRHAKREMGIGDPEALLAGCSVRFERPVKVGDTLSTRVVGAPGTVGFELLLQDGGVATRGTLQRVRGVDALPAAPEAWESESRRPASGVLYAQDLLQHGPAGESLGRTISEADVVRFATEVGETNPAYLNREFARATPTGGPVAPPMLTFCLAFSDFLEALLALRLPDAAFAGHLGDAWRLHRPVAIGETLRTRYRTLSCRASRSRPEMAIVEFGLQAIDTRGAVVQSGVVHMMIPGRPGD
jgi:acyl dehydratase